MQTLGIVCVIIALSLREVFYCMLAEAAVRYDGTRYDRRFALES